MYQAQHEPLVAGCCAERRLHTIRSIVLDSSQKAVSGGVARLHRREREVGFYTAAASLLHMHCAFASEMHGKTPLCKGPGERPGSWAAIVLMGVNFNVEGGIRLGD